MFPSSPPLFRQVWCEHTVFALPKARQLDRFEAVVFSFGRNKMYPFMEGLSFLPPRNVAVGELDCMSTGRGFVGALLPFFDAPEGSQTFSSSPLN